MFLSMLIFIPFLGAILAFKSAKLNIKLPRIIASFSVFFCCIIVMLITYKYFYLLKHNLLVNNYYLYNWKSWYSIFGINFHLGINGLSLIMVISTCLMAFCAILSEWENINSNSGSFYFFLLSLISGIFGIFISLDTFLFFCFWELIIIPMFFLIYNYGNVAQKKKFRFKVARKFFIYAQLSGFSLLISILGLSFAYYNSVGIWTFNYLVLKNTPMTLLIEFWLMLGFLLAFVIKMPLIPFHDWLPDTQLCTPISGSVDFLGIFLKTSIYGFLKFNLTFFPNIIHIFSPLLIILGIFSVLYGSIMAFSQDNFRKFIAYISISHTGLIFSILNCINLDSYKGVMLYMVSDLLTISAILILVKNIQKFFHTQNMYKIGNLWNINGCFTWFFQFFLLISIGFPGTGNFSGEILMLSSLFFYSPILSSILIFLLFLQVVCILKIIKTILYGDSSIENINLILSYRDIFLLFLFIVILFFIGLNPIFFISILSLDNINYVKSIF